MLGMQINSPLGYAPKALTSPCLWLCALLRSGNKLIRHEMDTGSKQSIRDARLCTPAAMRIEHAKTGQHSDLVLVLDGNSLTFDCQHCNVSSNWFV